MSAGPEQLRDWMERRGFGTQEHGLKITEAAAYLGLDKSIVGKLANGTRRAGLKIALHIEEKTGIPVQSWLSEDSDESGEPVASTAANHNEDS